MPVADASAFLESLHGRAAADRRTILFPEATDDRIVEAAVALQRRGTVCPILVRRGDAVAFVSLIFFLTPLTITGM